MSSASSGANPDAGVFVSVVLPCYNARASVRRAVESVEAQTLRPLEVIVVDDASTDGTAEVLSTLQSECVPGWLKVVRLESNRGPASARNAGWSAAAGEWIAFLDADDTWHPRKLEIQLGALRGHPDAALLAHRHDFADDPAPHAGGEPAARPVTRAALLVSNRFVTPSVVLRRDLPERFPEGQRHMEDHLLWMRLAYAGRKLLLVDAALATLHKPAFGASGQSAQLVAMQCAELGNYRTLWREGRIGAVLLLLVWAWSCVKFTRRLAIVGWRRLTG